MKVEDVMTREVRTVRSECSLKDVAALLSEHGIGGVPVVDAEGSPVGVICKADIVIKERAEIPARSWAWRKSDRDESGMVAMKVGARTAGEAMSAPAVTVDPRLPLSLAAEQMLGRGINRLVVVDREQL